ncbi:MAG: hypothetical protein K2M87_03065 [Muribaculaceae bacterium]|nr:hypothetical protein [Muribaculaceae bacterium]
MKKLTTALLLMAASVLTVLADQNTPYSMYGYGILGDRATSMQRQMGGVGVAMNSGRQVNVMNPASYSAVDSLTFLFDMGADLSIIWSQQGSVKERATGGGLDYVTMQFPLARHFGGSIGLVPYSSVGYAFGNEIKHGTMSNQGSGGINELYLGFSGEVKGFSLGVNVSYDFGNIVNDVFANPVGGSTKVEHVMRVRDWNILIGAQYTARFTRNDRIVAGLTWSPKKAMLGRTWVTKQETTLESKPTYLIDTNMRRLYQQPNTVGAGLSYTHEKVSRFNVELDYLWQDWSKAKFSSLYADDKLVFEGMNFQNRQRWSLGAEIVPKVRGSYLERVTYRVGAYYADDYLKIKGNGVREYGVTAGFGFPTPEGKTIVNLGLEWKHRQAHPQSLVAENYLNINLGINFNEVWFFKRKIR